MIKRKQHDSFLVTTYTSVKDIEALRDVRLDQLKGQRLAAEQYVDNLHSRLTALQTRAMLFKPYSSRPEARRMPDDLARFVAEQPLRCGIERLDTCLVIERNQAVDHVVQHRPNALATCAHRLLGSLSLDKAA